MVSSRKKLRVLIAAGPTREYLDPVRFLSNDSSGTMGFALARAALTLGARVTLVAGPVALETPDGVRRIDVVSAREMRTAVLRHATRADLIIMAAAVADWRPAHRNPAKMKKARGAPSIRLVANPDILAELGRGKKEGQLLVGFALETGDLERRAREKLRRKGCDWIVANREDAIGRAQSRALLLGAAGERLPLPRMPKDRMAQRVLSRILG